MTSYAEVAVEVAALMTQGPAHVNAGVWGGRGLRTPRYEFQRYGKLGGFAVFDAEDETRGVVGRVWQPGDPVDELIPLVVVRDLCVVHNATGDELAMARLLDHVETGKAFRASFSMQPPQLGDAVNGGGPGGGKNGFDRHPALVRCVPGRNGVLDVRTGDVVGWEEARERGWRFLRRVQAVWPEPDGPGLHVGAVEERAGAVRLRQTFRYLLGLDEAEGATDVERDGFGSHPELDVRELGIPLLRVAVGRSCTYDEQADWAVMLAGATGIGKTRLVEWLQRALGARCLNIGTEFAERAEPHPALQLRWDEYACLVTGDLHHVQPERLKGLARTGAVGAVRGMGRDVVHRSDFDGGSSVVEPRYQAWIQTNAGFARTPAPEHASRFVFMPLRGSRGEWDPRTKALLDDPWTDEEVGEALAWCLAARPGAWERDAQAQLRGRFFRGDGTAAGMGSQTSAALGEVLEAGGPQDWVWMDGVAGLAPWEGPLQAHGVDRLERSSAWQREIWHAVQGLAPEARRRVTQVSHRIRQAAVAAGGVVVPGRLYRVFGIQVRAEARGEYGPHLERVERARALLETLEVYGWAGGYTDGEG